MHDFLGVSRVLRLLGYGTLVLWLACGPAKQEPAQARRIVTLAPSLTETVFALGLGDRLVGTDDFSLWPAEARGLPKLGGLFNPNLEQLAVLAPDLAIVLPSSQDVAARATALGAGVLVVRHETLADIEAGALAIAQRCGVAERGQSFVGDFRAQLRPSPVGLGRSVLLVVGRPPGKLGEIVAAGPGTYLDELLTLLGAKNVLHDTPARWPQVALEEIIARSPYWVIELSSETLSPLESAARIAEWSALGELPAVVGHRVLVLSGDHTLVPGPRVARLYGELAEAMRKAP